MELQHFSARSTPGSITLPLAHLEPIGAWNSPPRPLKQTVSVNTDVYIVPEGEGEVKGLITSCHSRYPADILPTNNSMVYDISFFDHEKCIYG